MRFAKQMAAALLAACALGPVQAQTTIFSEGFEDVAGLAAQGWSFWNVGEDPSGPGWVPGSIFLPPEDGPLDSFIHSGYVATMNDSREPEYISAWLVTPEIKLTGSDKLTFWIQGPGPDFYQDQLRVLIAPGSATSPDQFVQTIFDISGPPPFWMSLSFQLPTDMTTARIAFQYYGSNANANYLALDSLSVTSAVPEPASLLMLGAGLGVALLRRRQHGVKTQAFAPRKA